MLLVRILCSSAGWGSPHFSILWMDGLAKIGTYRIFKRDGHFNARRRKSFTTPKFKKP
jgi:hypothetical protein